jgi:hypothetical protein
MVRFPGAVRAIGIGHVRSDVTRGLTALGQAGTNAALAPPGRDTSPDGHQPPQTPGPMFSKFTDASGGGVLHRWYAATNHPVDPTRCIIPYTTCITDASPPRQPVHSPLMHSVRVPMT